MQRSMVFSGIILMVINGKLCQGNTVLSPITSSKGFLLKFARVKLRDSLKKHVYKNILRMIDNRGVRLDFKNKIDQ